MPNKPKGNSHQTEMVTKYPRSIVSWAKRSKYLLFAPVYHCILAINIITLFCVLGARSEETPEVQWLPPAVVETRYNVALPVRGGEGGLSWEVEDELPPGLRLKGGLITGVPERVGTWQFGIAVRDELDGTLQTTFGIRVLSAPAPKLRIVSRRLPVAHRLNAYSGILQAEGGYPPYSWSVTAEDFPPWAKLDANKIRGTPRKPEVIGLNRFQVNIRDTQGNTAGPATVTLPVEDNPLVQPLDITPATELAPAVVDMSYRAVIQALGGVPPYRLSIKTDCPGLQYTGNGILSGKATEQGEFSVSVSLVDADGESRETKLLLPVVAPATGEMSVGQIQAISALQGEPLFFSVPVAGGLRPYEGRPATRLPPGLEWEGETHSISGIPTQAGEWECRINITDAADHTQSVRFPIQIQPAARNILKEEPKTEETEYFDKYWVHGIMATGWVVAACLAGLLWAARCRARKTKRTE